MCQFILGGNMYKQSYYCRKCGKMYFISSDVSPKTNCDFCSGKIIKTEHIIFEEHYKELLNNNEWNYKNIEYYCPLFKETNIHSQPTPKCPTCGSTNIRRISATEKVVNVGMFGLFGNKRKYQFECLNPNCKYKW